MTNQDSKKGYAMTQKQHRSRRSPKKALDPSVVSFPNPWAKISGDQKLIAANTALRVATLRTFGCLYIPRSAAVNTGSDEPSAGA